MKEEQAKQLTTKQRRFCEEYIVDWNATQAAIRAGYSEKTAYSIGQENLNKPEISAHIEEIQKDLAKLAGVSALRNLLELKKMAYTSTTEIYDGWITIKEFEEIPDDVKAAISEIQTNTRKIDDNEYLEVVKLKFHDKQKAIDMINKMIGANPPDKVELSGKGGGPVVFKEVIYDVSKHGDGSNTDA